MRTAFTDLLGVRPTQTGKPARQLRSAWHEE